VTWVWIFMLSVGLSRWSLRFFSCVQGSFCCSEGVTPSHA